MPETTCYVQQVFAMVTVGAGKGYPHTTCTRLRHVLSLYTNRSIHAGTGTSSNCRNTTDLHLQDRYGNAQMTSAFCTVSTIVGASWIRIGGSGSTSLDTHPQKARFEGNPHIATALNRLGCIAALSVT